jgi:hypothetical protein
MIHIEKKSLLAEETERMILCRERERERKINTWNIAYRPILSWYFFILECFSVEEYTVEDPLSVPSTVWILPSP